MHRRREISRTAKILTRLLLFLLSLFAAIFVRYQIAVVEVERKYPHEISRSEINDFSTQTGKNNHKKQEHKHTLTLLQNACYKWKNTNRNAHRRRIGKSLLSSCCWTCNLIATNQQQPNLATTITATTLTTTAIITYYQE